MSRNPRYYNWCFTSYIEPNFDNEKLLYCIYQKELCPSTNNIHWQGYLEIKEKHSRKGVQKICNNPMLHLETRLGTQEQAIEYYMKLDTKIGEPILYGKPKKQGKRSDLDTMVEAIENGLTAKEILSEFRGNALRHLGMITRGLRIYHEYDLMDKLIREKRDGYCDLTKLNEIQKLTKEDAKFNGIENA